MTHPCKHLAHDEEEQHQLVGGAAHPRASTHSKVHTALLFINTLVLVLILAVAGHGYFRMHRQLQQYNDIVNIFVSPKPDPVMAGNVANFMNEATSAFFFGASNGSVPVFLQNSIFSYNYQTLGQSIEKFASTVYSVMNDASQSKSCVDYVQCPSNIPPYGEQMACVNGNVVWCNYAGQTVNCATESCISPNVASMASIVQSVAGLVAKVPTVNDKDVSAEGAFSDGVFRIDAVLNWAKAQSVSTQWQAAAKACQKLVFGVKSVNWQGTYFDTDGQQQTWDSNKDVRNILGYVEQVCDPLINLSEKQNKKN